MGPSPLLAVRLLFTLQATQATIVGGVRDEQSHEPLAGAVVALPGLRQSTTTGADGRYVLREVPSGPQQVVVRFIGYAPRTLYALVPSNGQVEISITLRPLSYVLPAVAVRSHVAVRGLEETEGAAYPERVSSMAAARDNPLLAERDAFSALSGGEVVLSPEFPGGVHVRGGGSDATAYLLDGVPVLSPYHAAGVFSAWNPDALSQMQLSSAAPSPAYPDALSGTLTGRTRTPGAGLGSQASLGTAQERLTVDGPLGVADLGFLVSLRTGRPAFLGARDPTSYLNATTDDWLAKLEGPALGGTMRLLGYESENGITAAATAGTTNGAGDARRNLFSWCSRSLGAEWTRSFGDLGLSLLAWRASGGATAEWSAQAGWLTMGSSRRDEGILATGERHTAGASTLAGIRVNRSQTSYRIEPDSAVGPASRVGARTPTVSLFALHARAIGRRLDLSMGASATAGGGAFRLAPVARVRWSASTRTTISGSYARRHQYAQSLRNAESVVGYVFPADLYVGVGAPGIPVARSDQAVIAADYRPAAGARFGVQAYARAFDGLVLVAPRSGEPFMTGAYAVGSGSSRGLSVDAEVGASRWAVLGSYGLQRTLLRYDRINYVPGHGATHLFEAGAIVFPDPSFSIRLGVTAALGRRTTPLSGGFEWESCNLRDRGCEFAGSPRQGGEPPGATTLPSYLRLDLGLRKTWHIRTFGRDGTVALFGTVTNLLNRTNALTYARDPTTGELSTVAMRPRAPLVVGLDWRF